MRLVSLLCASLVLALPSFAEVVQVPLLADGTVDLEKVYSGFVISYPVYDNGAPPTVFSGELLGEPFEGKVIGTDVQQGYALQIDAPTLSEHGNFLIAVSVTAGVCLRHNLSPGLVLWKDAKRPDGTFWVVETSCTAKRE